MKRAGRTRVVTVIERRCARVSGVYETRSDTPIRLKSLCFAFCQSRASYQSVLRKRIKSSLSRREKPI